MKCSDKYESFTLLGATKDDCKIFKAYVSQSVGNVLCTVSTKLSHFALKTSISRNDLSSRPTVFDQLTVTDVHKLCTYCKCCI